MYLNFETILTLVTLASFIIWLVDSLFFAKKRLMQQGILSAEQPVPFLKRMSLIYGDTSAHVNVKMPKLVEYTRAFFPILLVVLLLRSFFFEPFRIPSGSDEPTLLIGDLIVVNKHIYGLRLPILNNKIWQNEEPKLGDIVIFRFPQDPGMDLIKRVVGGPGDHVSYINKVLFVNGIKAPQEMQGDATDDDGDGTKWPVEVKREDLLGVSHLIYQRPNVPAQDFEVKVPAGQYFVMGDNRDSSFDSRFWGFVPESAMVGKATYIWMSWNGFKDGITHIIRWDRIGRRVH